MSYSGEPWSLSELRFGFPLFFLLSWLDPVVPSLLSAEQDRRTTHRRNQWSTQASGKNDESVAFHTWLGIQLLSWTTVPAANTLSAWIRTAARLGMLPALSRRLCLKEQSLGVRRDSGHSSGPEPGLFWLVVAGQELMMAKPWGPMVGLERSRGEMWTMWGVLEMVRIYGVHHPGRLNVQGMKGAITAGPSR